MIPEWLYRSPSPLTLCIYTLFSYYGYRKLSKGTIRWTLKWFLGDFTSAIFVLGIPVLIGDALWCMFSLLRFGSLFPNDVLLMVLSIARDVAGVLTCWLFIRRLFDRKVVSFTPDFWFIIIVVNFLFFVMWFGLAADPSVTDWTYAIIHGYDLSRILKTLVLSHGLGRAITFLAYREMWKI